MDFSLRWAIGQFVKLKTLKLVRVKNIDANFLLKVLRELKLTSLHIIAQNEPWLNESLHRFIHSALPFSYRDIAKAIKYSHTLKTLTFGFICSGIIYRYESRSELLGNVDFLELVKARRQSGAAGPLELFLTEREFDAFYADAKLVEDNVSVVQVKKLESLEDKKFYEGVRH